MRDINVNDEPVYRGPHTPETRGTLRKKEPIKERRQIILEEAIPDVKATAQRFFARRGEHRAAVERIRFPSHENQPTAGDFPERRRRGARLQHRGLSYHNLQERERDLADIRATRENLVRALAEVARLGQRDLCQPRGRR